MRLQTALLAFLFLLLVSACNSSLEELEGTWEVHEKSHRAQYLIKDKSVQVLSLYDGTMKYQYQGGKEKFITKHLRIQSSVDAIAGATNKDPVYSIVKLTADSILLCKSHRGRVEKELLIKE